jgi:acyl-CoA thioesterase-1
MRRRIAAAVVLALAALALASGRAAASSRVIVVLGDSLTAGPSLDDAYPAQLEARLGREGYDYRVVNAGVSGDTSAGGLRRVDWVLRQQPEIVIVALGANDGLRGLPVPALRQNLVAIVDRVRASGAKVLLAGMRVPPNYGAEYSREFMKAFEDVAREKHVPLMPFLLEGVAGHAHLNLADGIHPTPEGQRIIAEHVWPHLRALLTKPAAAKSPRAL